MKTTSTRNTPSGQQTTVEIDGEVIARFFGNDSTEMAERFNAVHITRIAVPETAQHASRLTSWQHVSERDGITANLSFLSDDGTRLGTPIAKNIQSSICTRLRDCWNAFSGIADPAAELARLRYECDQLCREKAEITNQKREQEDDAAAMREALASVIGLASSYVESQCMRAYEPTIEAARAALARKGGGR